MVAGCQTIVEIKGSVQFKISGISASDAFDRPLGGAESNTVIQSERNSLFGWLDIQLRILYIHTSMMGQRSS